MQSQGTLTNPRHEYSKDEILSAAKVASYYRNLILQWLRILTERGYIRQRGERFIGTEPLTSEAMQQRRNQVRESLKDTKLFSSLVIDYFMSHTEWLPQLMSGDKQQAILLMFPEGRMDIADALYRDTISVRYLNKSVAEAVVRIADGKDSLRILEISASTGATTDAVIHRLKASISKQINLDYLFVDVTNFFLTMVRERYEDCPWIHFQTIDINESLFEQGLRTENADIVIATDALNNVRNINEIVRDLMQALVPGGWMLVTEPTREIPVALISQTFMMIPPEDERKDANTTFLSTEQWLKVFYQAGAEKAVALPSDEHILAPIGQKLFIVKKARR
jgi:SAM-dependent methyltransferase